MVNHFIPSVITEGLVLPLGLVGPSLEKGPRPVASFKLEAFHSPTIANLVGIEVLPGARQSPHVPSPSQSCLFLLPTRLCFGCPCSA